jgi:hypothetical protein
MAEISISGLGSSFLPLFTECLEVQSSRKFESSSRTVVHL